jgi:hypothetical protein
MYLWGKVLKATMRLDSAAAAFRQVRPAVLLLLLLIMMLLFLPISHIRPPLPPLSHLTIHRPQSLAQNALLWTAYVAPSSISYKG